MIITLVAVGGGVGALCRYAVTGWVQRRSGSLRPWGTAAVNLSGTFLLGLFVGYLGGHSYPIADLSPLTTGFLGGYTTFSTWMVETLSLSAQGGSAGVRAGMLNLVLPSATGLVLAAAGHALGTLV
jgi:CrcB protein